MASAAAPRQRESGPPHLRHVPAGILEGLLELAFSAADELLVTPVGHGAWAAGGRQGESKQRCHARGAGGVTSKVAV